MTTGKLTLKQEAFAQAYIETGNASEAYRRAYDADKMKQTTVNRNAHTLLENNKIAARVVELQSKSAKKHEITTDYLTSKLKEILGKAMGEAKGASAAVSAIVALGKLHGLIVEKKHVTGDHKHHHTAEPVSASAEWLAELLGTGSVRAGAKSLPH